MKHSIFVNSKDFIEVQIVGPINVLEAVELGKRALTFSLSLEDLGKSVNFLIDSTLSPKHLEYPVSLISKIIDDLPVKKIASFGVSEAMLNEQAGQVTEAELNLLKKVKAFKTREEAESWLTVV